MSQARRRTADGDIGRRQGVAVPTGLNRGSGGSATPLPVSRARRAVWSAVVHYSDALQRGGVGSDSG